MEEERKKKTIGRNKRNSNSTIPSKANIKTFWNPIKSLLNKNKEPLPSIPEVNGELEADITQTPKQGINKIKGIITDTEGISEEVDTKGEEQIDKEPEGEFFGGMLIVPLTEGNAAEEVEELMSKFMPSENKRITSSRGDANDLKKNKSLKPKP